MGRRKGSKNLSEEEFFKRMYEEIRYQEEGRKDVEIFPVEHSFYETKTFGRASRTIPYKDFKVSEDYEAMAQGLKTIKKQREPWISIKSDELIYQYGRNPIIIIKDGKVYTEKRFLDKTYSECKRWRDPIRKAEHQASILLRMLKKLGYATFERKVNRK